MSAISSTSTPTSAPRVTATATHAPECETETCKPLPAIVGRPCGSPHIVHVRSTGTSAADHTVHAATIRRSSAAPVANRSRSAARLNRSRRARSTPSSRSRCHGRAKPTSAHHTSHGPPSTNRTLPDRRAITPASSTPAGNRAGVDERVGACAAAIGPAAGDGLGGDEVLIGDQRRMRWPRRPAAGRPRTTRGCSRRRRTLPQSVSDRRPVPPRHRAATAVTTSGPGSRRWTPARRTQTGAPCARWRCR